MAVSRPDSPMGGHSCVDAQSQKATCAGHGHAASSSHTVSARFLVDRCPLQHHHLHHHTASTASCGSWIFCFGTLYAGFLVFLHTFSSSWENCEEKRREEPVSKANRLLTEYNVGHDRAAVWPCHIISPTKPLATHHSDQESGESSARNNLADTLGSLESGLAAAEAPGPLHPSSFSSRSSSLIKTHQGLVRSSVQVLYLCYTPSTRDNHVRAEPLKKISSISALLVRPCLENFQQLRSPDTPHSQDPTPADSSR